jgi:hypothetical protein
MLQRWLEQIERWSKWNVGVNGTLEQMERWSKWNVGANGTRIL